MKLDGIVERMMEWSQCVNSPYSILLVTSSMNLETGVNIL